MKNIDQILKDLYELDPDLKSHEKELKELLKKLIEAKPDIVLDADFVSELRKALQERAGELSSEPGSNWLRSTIYALSGGAAVALLFIFFLNPFGPGNPLFQVLVKEVPDASFNLVSEGEQTAESSAFSARPQGGGGGGGIANTDAASRMVIEPYEPVQYNYVYEGTFNLIGDDQAAVYKRINEGVGDASLIRLLKNFDFGLIDLAGFDKLMVDNISISEDKAYGYQIQANFRENMISINQNWIKWPNHYESCTGDESCYERLRLKKEDLPADSELFAITDKFLDDYGISRSDYSDPVAIKPWENSVYFSPDSEVYIPEHITVVYPEVLEGRVVTEADGNQSGLTLTVSIRDERVSNLGNLRPRQYERSMYPVEKDLGVILGKAKTGGIYGDYVNEGTAKKVEVKLSDPELVYFRHYRYSREEGRSDEFLIPAYLFPIIRNEEYQNYRNYILIPAIQGFEELMETPVAMPLER